ncbi:MAG TPA: hypothetical protein VD931_12495 [Baekduia sp.]|nr:hypothetical protein [Baekduia sp.]
MPEGWEETATGGARYADRERDAYGFMSSADEMGYTWCVYVGNHTKGDVQQGFYEAVHAADAAIRALLALPAPGTIVQYNHPSWGPACGEVLRVDGPHVLVQDQAPNGAREWWPVAEIIVVDP